jgi:hypothetical protein
MTILLLPLLLGLRERKIENMIKSCHLYSIGGVTDHATMGMLHYEFEQDR